MSTPLQVLKDNFGYTIFRDQQAEIIDNVLSGRDALVLMPTGGGKSICYQVPALVQDGLTLVISPLIALMKDQVDALRLNGVDAAFLNSSLSSEQQSEVFQRLNDGKLKLLYVSPERLFAGEDFLDFLSSCNVKLIAVDEAHCVSQWGHDFRPEYLQLSKARKYLKKATLIALTATADELTKLDILDKLGFDDPRIFVSSFNRANIQYNVQPKQQSFDRLLEFLVSRKNESGIIYTLSRKQTEQLSNKLIEQGFNALPYHAGLNREVRDNNQEAFLKDNVNIIVATIAFGMGIDKSNVRFVIHMNMPKNIEGYYQETGRAGRDGLDSTALLFYTAGDLFQLKQFAMIEDNAAQSRVMLKKLDEMANYCELTTCRRKYLLNYFGEAAPDNCGSCDVCLNGPADMMDATKAARMAISAVIRLREYRGITYTVLLLTGSKSKELREEDSWLPTYGVGKEYSGKEWNRMIREFVKLDILRISDGEYPVLQLTPKSRAILREEERVMIPAPLKKKAAVVKKSGGRKELTEIQHPALFEQLRSQRKLLAMNENVPAFVVFSDAALLDMCDKLPKDDSEFLAVSGVGRAKLERYGAEFLAVIESYLAEQN